MISKRIGDILTLQRGFDITKNEQNEGSHPVISSSGINSFHDQYKVKGPGVIIGRKGSLGTAFFSEKDYWPHDTTLWVKDFKGNEPKFIYYLLKKLPLQKLDSGSANPTLNRNFVHKVKIEIPDLKTQKQIAKVLSDLDSKIELNTKINAELEGMAKLIYEYWFVQFDFPFDFAQGRPSDFAQGKPADKTSNPQDIKPYKSSGGKMVWNTELKREIPEGWEVKELKDIAEITMGQSPPGESYNENSEGTVFYQGCTDFGNRFPTIRKFTTMPTRFANEGDLLLSVRAPVGAINISKEHCCIGRGLASLAAKNGQKTFLFGVMQNLKQIFDRRNVDGTTFGAITKDDLFTIKVIKPEKSVLDHFHRTTITSFNKQNKCELENIQLSSIRDWLLPMLMNGQVRVMEQETK